MSTASPRPISAALHTMEVAEVTQSAVALACEIYAAPSVIHYTHAQKIRVCILLTQAVRRGGNFCYNNGI